MKKILSLLFTLLLLVSAAVAQDYIKTKRITITTAPSSDTDADTVGARNTAISAAGITAQKITDALTYTPANVTTLQAHTSNMSNPHFTTAGQVGAGALSGNNTWSGSNYFKTLGSSFVFIDQMAGTTWTQRLEAADSAYATDPSKIFIIPNDSTFDVDLIAHSFGHTIWHFLGNGFTIYQPTDNNFLQLSQDDEIGWLCTTSSGESCALWIEPATRRVTIPAIKSTTGTRYVCVDTTGKLVSSTTACSGT